MSFLQPDRYFSRISNIDIARDLVGRGFVHALLDIDNTLLTRDTHEIPRDVRNWLARAQEAGVSLCLLSNNWHASVHDVAADLGLPIVAKACKPLPHGFVLATRKLGGTRKDTVMIGDQLSTDVIGAHAVGMTAYLLQPLVDADILSTYYVRKIERLIIGNRQPEPASANALVPAAIDGAPSCAASGAVCVSGPAPSAPSASSANPKAGRVSAPASSAE